MFHALQKLIPQLPAKLGAYDATEKRTVPPELSLAAVKATIADLNLGDAATYPAWVAVAPLLAQWLDKAIATRELCVKFHSEKAEPEVRC